MVQYMYRLRLIKSVQFFGPQAVYGNSRASEVGFLGGLLLGSRTTVADLDAVQVLRGTLPMRIPRDMNHAVSCGPNCFLHATITSLLVCYGSLF